jgi:putative transposase
VSHAHGKTFHPMIRGKIERWHLSLKSRILLESYYLLGDLERAVASFVEHYNHCRYYESVDNHERAAATIVVSQLAAC